MGDQFDIGPDAAATFAALSPGNFAAGNERGELDSIMKIGDHEFPGAVAVTINTLDAYVHGRDIAQATRQHAHLDPGLRAHLLRKKES